MERPTESEHRKAQTRRIAVIAAALATTLAGTSCDLMLYPGYRVSLLNNGRDPIHVGGIRCPQDKATHITYVGGEYREYEELSLSRNDINLGKLRVRGKTATAKSSCLITMTEPVYFDFHFVSEDTTKVSVEYIKP